MQCGVVTGTGADMLSHCDEKHSEMMWRECSSCPQRDGKPAVAFVYSFVPPCLCESLCVHTCWLFSGCTCDCVRLLPVVQSHITSHAKCVVMLLFFDVAVV